MTFTLPPSNETWHGSVEHQRESGFKFLRHKIKLGGQSSSGSPTIVTAHPKKKSGTVKETFIQKTKRKLFRKTKKSSTTKPKAEESKEPQIKPECMQPEHDQGEEKLIEEKLLDFPGKIRIGSEAIKNKTADVKNKYCSSITKPTNYGEVHAFVTQPKSMLRVMYDFRAREENDVSVRRGEMVTVLNKDDDDWWWVENSKLQQGFVPKKYVWPCSCYGKAFVNVAVFDSVFSSSEVSLAY